MDERTLVQCTPDQIEQITKHLRDCVATITKQENLDITFGDFTDFDGSGLGLIGPHFIVIEFNKSRPARVITDDPSPDGQDEIPF